MLKFRKTIFLVAGVFLIMFLVRVLLFQTVRTDKFNMASTILPGDRVWVNKFRAGWRLPNSIIGIPGANARYADWFRLPYYRLPAIKRLERDEIIAFNRPTGTDSPIDRKPVLISRLVAFPGDTVLVWDKQLYINRVIIEPPSLSRSEYRVITDGREIDRNFLKENTVELPRLVESIGIYDVDLTPEASEALAKLPEIRTVRATKQFAGDSSIDFFPSSNFYMWNRDQFGPLIVPRKGQTVELSVNNADLYRDIIENHERNLFMVDFRGVTINGRPVENYTFRKDYYFVMDDNRDNPNDSRIFGFVPADHVIGVARRIAWSHQNKHEYLKKLQLKRICKRIR